MRKAFDRFKELYGTRLGRDVVETLGYGGVAATGQVLFTDMTPEEIMLSTGLGMGAAAVGRPLMGRAGRALGNRLAKNPGFNQAAEEVLGEMANSPRRWQNNVADVYFKPYSDNSAPAQILEPLGRAYGDNVMQALVALGAPIVMGGQDNA